MSRPKAEKKEISTTADHLVNEVLEGLAAILLRMGVDAPQAEVQFRRAFVQQAAKRVWKTNSRNTQSQIALLAGVSRLEVRRILASKSSVGDTQRVVRQSRVERILNAWRRDPKFSNGRGQAKSLTFVGAGNQFEKLVRKYGRDVTVRTLQDDLIRNKIATTRNRRIKLSDNTSPKRSREAAALADLSFICTQLSQFSPHAGRRIFASRKLNLSAVDAKTLRLIQRKAISRIETTLVALESLKRFSSPSSTARQTRNHRLVITTTLLAESDYNEN